MDRFLAPNGITPRLIYRVGGADGRTGTRNAQVERDLWDQLEGAETVWVVYVPEDPSISRLAHGEIEPTDLLDQPFAQYALSALVSVMSLFFLIAASLMWHGYDLDLDSKTRRISIKRFGTAR